MKVKFLSDEFRTQLPVTIDIESSSKPTVTLEPLGELEVLTIPSGYRAQFHVMEPLKYSLIVKNASEEWRKDIYFEEQQFLKFDKEFGFFLILFFMMLGGVILWTRKLMKNH
jgi:hypothetical protein